MTHVDDQELLLRADNVAKAGEKYRDFVFALEIYRSRYDRYLSELKMAIKKEIAKEGEKISETELERIALADKRWKEIEIKAISYLERAGRAKIDFQVAVSSLEAMRSALSSRRAEISAFKG